ncbi:hypothetical protein QE412_001415 [Microbacterium trichothecenolyticum]|uniref:Uncharacterized protein n=1 Tax=Microbacterium trichothecenolyticum TaxID=69370 RepID=A0ABU0TT51_MICTR|nr:hypothetical protein [Microbacterium trichothecenolyticum]
MLVGFAGRRPRLAVFGGNDLRGNRVDFTHDGYALLTAIRSASTLTVGRAKRIGRPAHQATGVAHTEEILMSRGSVPPPPPPP